MSDLIDAQLKKGVLELCVLELLSHGESYAYEIASRLADAIGMGETHTSADVHEQRDARSLLAALQHEVVPCYYDRDRDGLPRHWIARIKRAIRTMGWRFSADRMVMDYVQQAYIPAAGGTSSEARSY